MLAALLSTALGCSGLGGPAAAPTDSVPLPAELVVRSNVRGDSVRIDGELVGASGPHGHRVPAGRHIVSVAKPGYPTWTTAVDLVSGETRVLRAVLAPSETAPGSSPTDESAWRESVARLSEQLRGGWGQSIPPSDFSVSDDGVMAFRVQSPGDGSAWHHFRLDLREISVSSVEHLPSVVNLECATGSPCIRQEICRESGCAEANSVARHKWFFDDDEHGERVVRVFAQVIELARRRALAAHRNG